MKKLIKKTIFALSFILLCLGTFTSSIWASTYGDCTYGSSLYSSGSCGSSSSNSSSSDSSGSTDTSCKDQSPGSKTPWLYAATSESGTSIRLYFADADDPVSYYALEFGPESGNYPWGATNIGGKGIRSYLVESLQPNTTYYFKIRAGNGCATGEWGNEISATTKGTFGYRQILFEDTSISPETNQEETETSSSSTKKSEKKTDSSKKDQNEEEKEKTSETENGVPTKGYKLNVIVTNEQQQPVVGAKVTLHSKVQEMTTNEAGVAKFEDVEPGEHKIIVEHEDYNGEQSINLSGDDTVLNLTITIKKQNVLTSPKVLSIIAGLVLVILILGAFLVASRRKIANISKLKI